MNAIQTKHAQGNTLSPLRVMTFGLLQGLLLLATDAVTGRIFHPNLVTGILLLVHVISDKGRRLNGLAETFNAISATSGQDGDADIQKTLSLPQPPVTGHTGATAILFSLGIKYLALNSLTNFLPFTYYSSLLFFPVISKWAMVICMFHGRPTAENRCKSIFIHTIGWKKVALSTMLLVLLFVLPHLFFGAYIPDNQFMFYTALLITVYCVCRVWVHFFQKKFRGLTGYMLGAVSEITEVLFLFGVILWSRFSI